MALTQDTGVTVTQFTGQTLVVHLRVSGGKVHLNYIAMPKGVGIYNESADVGSGAATTLLSYFDLDTGELTSEGETHAKALPYNGNTIDTYFS